MKAIVLAGGKGTRLAPYTTVLPKPLMPLGDYPILEIVLRQLKRAGFKEVTIAVGYLAHLIKAYFDSGKRLRISIDYSFEEKPLGTIGPLKLIPRPTDTFLVMNGDILTDLKFQRLIEYHKVHKATLTIGLHKREHQINLGYVEHDRDFNITDYIEKPVHTYYVAMGIYVFEPKVYDYLEPDTKIDFPDLVLNLIKNKEKVIAYPSDAYWLDIGRPEDYEVAQNQFEKMKHLFLAGDEK